MQQHEERRVYDGLVRTTIDLEEALHRALKILAAEKQTTMKALIVAALVEYLRERK